MKLKNKLIIACVTVSILVIGVGTIGLRTANTINENFDTVTTKTAPALIALGQASTAFLRAENEIISVALLTHGIQHLPDQEKLPYQQELQQEQEEWQEALAQLEDGIRQYELLTAGNSHTQNLAPIFRQQKIALQQEIQTIVDSTRHQLVEEALLEQKDEIEKIEDQFFLAMDKAIVSELMALDTGNQLAHHSADHALVINLMAIVIFIILVSVIGMVVTKTIASPIITLNTTAMAVAAGQLEVRVTINTNDEIGQLAKTFNYMIERLQSLYTHVETAREHAEAANRAKSLFLAHISHELRTPLNGILGYTQILTRDKTLTEKQLQGIQVIEHSGEYLLALINEVLDLSKIEAGKIEFTPTNFNLSQTIQSIIDLFQKRIQQKGLEFIYRPLSPLPSAVYADEKRLRQILINLIGNAVKFTDNGCVTLTVEAKEITETATPLVTIHFQVTDTGIGIAPADLERIFLPFERVGEQTYKYEGTGLGLPITKKLVELLGSSLQVNSVVGEGSSFGFTLVLPETIDTLAITALTTEPEVIIGFEGPAHKILVIDDYWANRSVLVNLLMPLGFEMLEASNGKEGLQLALKWLPDIVVTNLTMPLMDGLELTRHLRNSETLKHIPIIVVSASVFESDQQKSLAAGCNAFLPKPVIVKDLLTVLQTQLKLTWIYEPRQETPVMSSQMRRGEPIINTDLATVKLSPEQTQTLSNLVAMGDFGGIWEYAEELGQDNPQLLPLVHHIQQLAKEFKEGEISRLLESTSP